MDPDLGDLRGFIEAQKMRLQQEREMLRRPLSASDTLQDRDKFWKPSTGESFETGTTLASEVSDALCQRINSLNVFKDQLLPQPNEEVVLDGPTNNEEISGKAATSSKDSNQVSGIQSKINNNFEQQDADSVKLDELKEIPQREENASKSIKITEKHNSFNSRKDKIEKLQERLASASFWDDFGRSATSKKWSADAADTMVRIGEFSPANPDLQAPLGLGEYEERRRQLLEKKKQEYKEYLSQNRNYLQRTDHFVHPSMKSSGSLLEAAPKAVSFSPSSNAVDAATQTDMYLIQQSLKRNHLLGVPEFQSAQAMSSGVDSSPQPLSPREKLNMELRHHCSPCFVPRAHASQTTEQLPDVRMRQLQLQEELRLQIEEKRKMEAERREQERLEEDALQRRVAEQQAKLQAEYERDERLRREREIQKQQQYEEFERRREELRAESEALKQEERRQKLEAAESCYQKQVQQHPGSETSKSSKSGHLVPPAEPAASSIRKSSSPPLRSPRRMVQGYEHLDQGPPSPRALIKVLEGPTLSKRGTCLEDSLPIPLMPAAHNDALSLPVHRSPHHTPHTSPHRSPNRSPHKSPPRSPSRFVPDPWPNNQMSSQPHYTSMRQPSEAMQNLEERWKVPAVQKNVCVRGKAKAQNGSSNVLTQLGAFRRQLQLEHMRMEEKVRESHQPNQYHQKYYQQHVGQRGHHY